MLLTLLPLLALVASIAADCSKDFLRNATAAYIAAQSTGQTGLLSSFGVTANFLYVENNQLADWKSSTLSMPIRIDAHRSIHDVLQCATFTEIIAAANPHPYVIHTRIVFDSSQKVALVESVVTDEGDWLFNATGTLALVTPEKWDPIPKEKQESRETIQAYADAYFNRFGNVSVVVPWGAPCERVEGGLPAKGELRGADCVMVWPSTIYVPYRRYVVDEEYGAVDIFVGFPGLDRTRNNQAAPDSHFFRGEAGKIKYLHTASACWTAGCGLNGTTFGRR